jgi:fused signal recognition particle receptor
LTHALQKQGLSTVLAAADTFRAASIEQLEKHAAKLNVKVIKHHYGADPAAVAFDAIAHAKARGIDTVLIDTAGRMHTKANLLNEMQKICRVAKPHLKIFVGEAITGNDAVEQAKSFNESIGIDASILSKADVDEKAGAIISISYVTKKPILYLGTGQGYDDLKLFSKQEFITSLGL